MVEADLVRPGENPARVVEPVDHARRRCPRRCPRPRRGRTRASLMTWQTIRPSTSPGASPTHTVCLPRVAKKRSAALRRRFGACPGRGSARPAGSDRQRRQGVEADGGAARVERRQRAAAARRSPAGPPCSGASGSSPPVRSRIRNGAGRASASSGVGDVPAGVARPRRSSSIASGESPAITTSPSPPPRRRGSGSGGRCWPRLRVLVVAAAGLAAEAPGGDRPDRDRRRLASVARRSSARRTSARRRARRRRRPGP